MEINYKKIGLIAGFVLLSILIGWAIYALFFSSTVIEEPIATEDTATGGGNLPQAGIGSDLDVIGGSGGGLPTIGDTGTGETEITADNVAQGSITKTKTLTETPGLAPTLASNGANLFYYNRDDSKFYRLDKSGNITALSDKKFFNAEKIVWSDQKNKAIIEYPDGANIVYNFNTKKQVSLPKHWEDFNFSPDGNNIVSKSIGLDPENRWLVIANDDGSQAQAIEPLGINGDKVISSWSPNNQSVALFPESIDFDRQRVYFIGKNKENFKTTTVEGRGFDPLWDPNGQRLVYSVYSSSSELKPQLWIVDAQGDGIGDNRQRLGIQTWANKCNFANKTDLYCAVPKELPEGAGLFPQLAQESSDVIYKVNLTTGAKTLVAIPDDNYNIDNIVVTDNESDIYFTDATTGLIHTMKLR